MVIMIISFINNELDELNELYYEKVLCSNCYGHDDYDSDGWRSQ